MDSISPYFLAIIIAWFASHALKYLIAVIRKEQIDFRHQLFISGGMPSAHVATAMAVWAVVLLKDGALSGLFGIITLVVLIVGHDAVRLRRYSGEQGEAIATLIKESKSKAKVPKIAKGHTPLEVVVGGVFGLVVGFVVFFAMNA